MPYSKRRDGTYKVNNWKPSVRGRTVLLVCSTWYIAQNHNIRQVSNFKYGTGEFAIWSRAMEHNEQGNGEYKY